MEIQKEAAEIVERFAAQELAVEPAHLSASELAAIIDHTLLSPDATPNAFENLCAEAREYGFASVCVQPYYVALCVRALEGTGIPVCSTVGFPLGSTLPAVKAYEARQALKKGAREIDMVMNVGLLKVGGYAAVVDDIAAVVEVAHGADALCKVIIETALLTDEEKAAACLLIVEAGADYCKSSTGFAPGGATVRDVALMRAAVGKRAGVKAAGGIHSYEEAMMMVGAGATRIGASHGVEIVEGAP
ncbi:MAG: deoxyribose-phosphate aldolase [Chloroflexota bacterium]|nr:deoxyribose-phosphate aldolase [Chloroflexota bacterium]